MFSRRRQRALVAIFSCLLCASCGAEDDDSGDAAMTSSSSGDGVSSSSSSGDGVSSSSGALEVPQGADALDPWLAASEYREWTAESALHSTTGPHFGGVRVYINEALLESLEAGDAEHPTGAAAVKELYGEGETILGYSVLLKVDADSAGGAGFYWYETYNDTIFADGTGVGLCTNCHGGGQDYFLSPFPLQ